MSLQHQSPAADRAHWKDRLEWMSAGSLARLVAEGKISSELLTKHFIRRIERLDRHRGVNAVAVRCFDAALQRARDADRALADGRSWGCLHGVPLTVKESLALKGVTTSSALPRLKDFAPAANAVVVQRLLDAGAIIIGKTNLPVNCGDLQSYNAVYGTTCNPWDLERTPGACARYPFLFRRGAAWRGVLVQRAVVVVLLCREHAWRTLFNALCLVALHQVAPVVAPQPLWQQDFHQSKSGVTLLGRCGSLLRSAEWRRTSPRKASSACMGTFLHSRFCRSTGIWPSSGQWLDAATT